MRPNPYLKHLGLSDTDRAVIIHVDDIGMCQASIAAFADLVDFGVISSGAVMVPCPWFPSAAAYCRAHPGVDVGVHLTLNCEWDAYRWGPVSTRAAESGLIDAEGYLFRAPDDTYRHADPNAVQAEIETQVNRALQAGIGVTHIDTHMGTVIRYFPAYVQLAIQRRIPAFILRMDADGYRQGLGMDRESAEGAAKAVQELEGSGVPLVDSFVMLPLDQPEDRIGQAKRALGELPEGITHFVIHAAKDSPELRAIAPDWPSRVADYQAFTSEALREYVRAAGIHVMGYRAVRDAWSSRLG